MATYDGKIKNTGGQVVKGPYATHEGRVKGTVHKGGDMRTGKK